MQTMDWHYQTDDFTGHGFTAYDDKQSGSRPVVLVAHDWSGCNDFARQQAQRLAELGYLGIAVDLFGGGTTAQRNEDKMALIQPLLEDRSLIMQRWQAMLDNLDQIDQADIKQIAAIGFCFGGLCVLDLARHTDKIRGVVSFHGLLNPPEQPANRSIDSKILVLHGYDDPMVPPAQVEDFAREMTKAKADWQIHMYGHTQHAFTNPQAHDFDLGTVYNEHTAQRAFLAMQNFLTEIFTSV
jgi:dienelactone hydrolase